jgi:ribosomal protein S18 acetylase RimI-like enzyme
VSVAEPIVLRRAVASDRRALGRLGATLMRIHHRFDEHRFMAPGDDPEPGYADFLRAQMDNPDMLVLVAERPVPGHEAAVVGYVYAGIEPESFKELRARAGYIHDLLVAEDARGAGVGPRLIEAAVDWLRDQGMPRVLLWTAAPNEQARRLFEAHGFRATMIEMTRDLNPAAGARSD